MKREETAMRLHAGDNVIVTTCKIPAGSEVSDNGALLRLSDPIPFGHKIATEAIKNGDAVRKYGQIIGFATRDIASGEHVHEHNLAFAEFARDYEFGVEAAPTEFVAEAERASFQGIVRADGRVATRNYLAVITSVNCSATVARYICDHFRGAAMERWPNVDGVIALTHGSGCGTAAHGDGWDYLRRSIAGYSRHPNIAGTLLLGLGCEINQLDGMVADLGLIPGEMLHTMTIQGEGGTNATVRRGIECIEAMLPAANNVKRETVPASHIILGMECGGSDAFSGVTANPALGAAADLLVRHGGTAILGETPEIYGAEHLLIRRAESEAVGRKLLERIAWWEDYTKMNGAVVDNNPSPGNKAGGLTTILEKSLGAAAKGGTSNLVAVYRYAETVESKGFVFMDTPGYDPVSITGMVAGGANVVCFTTGRGSVFGCKPTPSLKLATNSTMFEHMHEDMDINCGRIVDGEADIEGLGREIFELILNTASGAPSKSEAFGFGDEEFVPWQIGAVL
ncbi:MAG: altronate dehydratase [Rhodospirillaceae bacterium]|nr:altronate dehydratase [Rhodospirillaceae bacterium]MBT6828083.1 altronate dehydratase [Rhodospirillaceae bacterium]MBT7293021.1 altronate dehydratase [Rhodospirillaceae bacterium]